MSIELRMLTRVALMTALSASGSLTSSLALSAPADTPAQDPLARGFVDPPNSARPRVWWHWMNGNVTKEGIQKDLDWMSSVGIGGMQNFDAALATPQMVERRLAYMTPEWKDAFRFAAQLAESKGLELAIAASPGWSETGGPWVEPKDGMKKLTWSETVVEGGKALSLRLPAPPSTTGPYGDTHRVGHVVATDTGTPDPVLYADSRVLACRLPDFGPPLDPPTMKVNGETSTDPVKLTDHSAQTSVLVPRGSKDAPGFVTIDYARPQTVRSLSIALGEFGRIFRVTDVKPRLEASDDGKAWRTIVAEIPIYNGLPSTAAFAPVTAARFRVVFVPFPLPDVRASLGTAPGAVPAPILAQVDLVVREIRLSNEARVDAFESKAGFSVALDYYKLPTLSDDSGATAPTDVVDVTDKLAPDGTLTWTPPPGRWKILRMGYSLTGTTNHPATLEATGLEADKFDAVAVRAYMEHYLDTFKATTGAELMGSHGLRAVIVDSIETGPSNWTRDIVSKFKALRGYDPTAYLPALTGVIVASRQKSDAFLYDWRRTLADLMAAEHYGEVAKVVHERGLTLYGEALENERPTLGDDMAMRRYADVPMAALWTKPDDVPGRRSRFGDMKGAASVAHLYGQNLVAAESLTAGYAPWAFAPNDLKRFMDQEFAYGINRPVIHTSVHQPVDDKVPGVSLGVFGQYFNRHETWASMAKPWVDYMARSSYLLQQGHYVADVAYFYGEEAPLTALYAGGPLTDVPVKYAYDFVNPDGVMNQLKVDTGDLVTPTGIRYRVLYLGGSSLHMTVPMLRRLSNLAEAGATIVGHKPGSTPSLADDPAEFASLTARLWSGAATTRIGAGQVIDSGDVEGALQTIAVKPDFAFEKPQADSEVLFLHRRLTDGDVYFLSNRQNRPEAIKAQFRIAGKAPELWHAETGKSEAASYSVADGVTTVPLDLLGNDAVFVVFRKPAGANTLTVPAVATRIAATLSGAWDVAFQKDRGAPPSVRLGALASLSENADPGIKYFSGISTYTQSFDLPRGTNTSGLWLDLGKVADVAEVRINGQSAGIAWKAPYRVDVSGLARSGQNTVEVRVANLWVNRLIGDRQPGVKPITYTTAPTYLPDAPLRPSGLLGPVTVLAQK